MASCLRACWFAASWIFTLFASRALCYKPVIIMHGILDKAADLQGLADFITAAHPGTNVTLIDLFDELSCFTPLPKQVEVISEKIRPLMKDAQHGVHMIGFSQGGITVRSIIETMSDHNVDTFVSLSGPLMGQFGVTDYLKPYLPTAAAKDMYKYFYTKLAQDTFALANYWNDPLHRDLNLKYNVFLPVINNNRSSPFYNESASKIRKENFLRIKKLILIGGPDDGVITPWQSSHFGFYDENQEVVQMKDQEVYLEDSFGLQTLDKRSAIHVYSISNVKHTDWHKKKNVFDMAIEPWLT